MVFVAYDARRVATRSWSRFPVHRAASARAVRRGAWQTPRRTCPQQLIDQTAVNGWQSSTRMLKRRPARLHARHGGHLRAVLDVCEAAQAARGDETGQTSTDDDRLHALTR